jgi:hypothetical protein
MFELNGEVEGLEWTNLPNFANCMTRRAMLLELPNVVRGVITTECCEVLVRLGADEETMPVRKR